MSWRLPFRAMVMPRPSWLRVCGLAGWCLCVGAGAVVAGQADPLSPPQPGNLSPAETQRLFDAYTIVQAQEMLRLDDAKYGQFVVRLKALQETRRRAQQERQRYLQDLARLTAPEQASVDEARVRERLRAMQEHEVQSAEALRKAYDAVDEVLDLRQQARFRVFEEQMERRKFQLLLRARERVDRPNAPRPPRR